jgi:transcriptional regulator of nitric oxide reductase
MKQILIPISPGELLDKITILEIKSARISSSEKLANVNRELGMLNQVWNDAVNEDEALQQMRAEIKSINEALWDIEDDIRDEERAKRFGERFIELARSVYVTNDQRADVKKRINLHLKSDIVEEKSYQDYQ